MSASDFDGIIYFSAATLTYPQIAVMSYNEISNNIKAKSIGVVRVEAMKV